MTLNHPLLEGWQRRLGEALERAELDPRSEWFWQVRAKVLRYLIARYEEDPPSGFDEPAPGAPPPAFIDLPRDGPRPLKSSAWIRAVLERIRG